MLVRFLISGMYKAWFRGSEFYVFVFNEWYSEFLILQSLSAELLENMGKFTQQGIFEILLLFYIWLIESSLIDHELSDEVECTPNPWLSLGPL